MEPGSWTSTLDLPANFLQMHDGYLLWMLKNFPESPLWNAAPDEAESTLVTDLKSCSDLHCGRKIHMKAMDSQHDSNSYVATALVKMYVKCGSMVDARRVFESIDKPNVVCWNALHLGYVDNGEGLATLELFSRMKTCGCLPDSVTYIAALKACASLGSRAGDGQCKWLEHGRVIHCLIGCDLGIFVQSTLIDMYGKCGSMSDARRVFESIEKPNMVCWNALLMGYVENEESLVTLDLFSRMKASGCAPGSVTYISALKACISLAGKRDAGGQVEWLERGRKIHSEIRCGLGIFLQCTLVQMYAKCGSMVDARCVFENIKKPNVVCWNSLLLGYVENEEELAALELFSRMKASGCAPDSVTYIACVKACTSLAGKRGGGEWLERGKAMHAEMGCNLGNPAHNTLIDMYGKCGSIVNARRVFEIIQRPDVVSWTALLLGYAENGDGFSALALFSKMKACGCAPNSVTYVAALKSCGLTGALALGRKLHSEIRDFSAHAVTCLVDFYAKCGSIVEARKVFDEHSRARDVSAWTALLTGYSSFGDFVSVFNLFEAMQDQGFRPDAVTFVCILSCCSHAGLVQKARKYLEAMPLQYGVTPTVMHYNCIVDILGRGNQLDEAIAVLREMPCNPDAVSWMTLLGACRKWKNVEIGRFVFQSLIDIDKKNAPAYVLMAHIYGSRGMWEEQERVLQGIGARKITEKAYVYDEVGNMVKFVVGQDDTLEFKIKFEQLMKEFVDGFEFSFSNYDEEVEKEKTFCGHTERRAAVYGILEAAPGEPVRAFKNMRLCDECHGLINMMSKHFGRVIMIKDSTKFHVMVNGNCSCGDYW